MEDKEARRAWRGTARGRLWAVWYAMKSRCCNPDAYNYAAYGGRGIKLCDEWQHFENFLQWALEAGYGAGLSIDRIDNNSGYRPDNCRWTNWKVQNLNRRDTVLLEYKGLRLTIGEWAAITSLPYPVIVQRRGYNWDVESIIMRPIRECYRKKHA